MTEDQEPPAAHYNNLQAALETAEAMLSQGVTDFDAAFRTVCFATHNFEGFPEARMLILRGFDPAGRRMSFFTDIRTPKINEIANNPKVAFLFYDAPAKVQIRIDALATIKTSDADVRSIWDDLPIESRRNYMADPAPAYTVSEPTSGLPDDLRHILPNMEQTENAYNNFAIIDVQIKSLDWLFLAPTGNRRAQFTWIDDALSFSEPSQSVWLVP